MGGRGGSSISSNTRQNELRERAENLHKLMKESGMPVVKSIEETMEILDKSDKEIKPFTTEYIQAQQKARQEIAIKEAKAREEAQRKKEATAEYQKNFEKYRQKNIEWGKKISESIKLANQGKLDEANKVWDEGERIYKSIPKDYRKAIKE